MLRLDQIKIRVSDKQPDIRGAVCSKLKISYSDIIDIGMIRRSLDARKKPELYYVLSLWAEVRNEEKLLKIFQGCQCIFVQEKGIHTSGSRKRRTD